MNWTGRMLWIIGDGGSWYKGWLMIRIGVSGCMFLLVLAHSQTKGCKTGVVVVVLPLCGNLLRETRRMSADCADSRRQMIQECTHFVRKEHVKDVSKAKARWSILTPHIQVASTCTATQYVTYDSQFTKLLHHSKATNTSEKHVHCSVKRLCLDCKFEINHAA